MSELAVAFDVETLEQALALDHRLGEGPELAKVGLQLFAAAGPAAVRALADRGRRVFLDLKLHDIPNTVRGAAAAAGALGAELLTVHATGGEAMVRAAVEGAASAGRGTRIVAVTLLTSLDPGAMPPGFARPFDLGATVCDLLEMTERAGAHGIVCSAADLEGLRRRRAGHPPGGRRGPRPEARRHHHRRGATGGRPAGPGPRRHRRARSAGRAGGGPGGARRGPGTAGGMRRCPAAGPTGVAMRNPVRRNPLTSPAPWRSRQGNEKRPAA
jgi:orotidine-5'-phosphate decarboxylase